MRKQIASIVLAAAVLLIGVSTMAYGDGETDKSSSENSLQLPVGENGEIVVLSYDPDGNIYIALPSGTEQCSLYINGNEVPCTLTASAFAMVKNEIALGSGSYELTIKTSDGEMMVINIENGALQPISVPKPNFGAGLPMPNLPYPAAALTVQLPSESPVPSESPARPEPSATYD